MKDSGEIKSASIWKIWRRMRNSNKFSGKKDRVRTKLRKAIKLAPKKQFPF